MAAQKCILKGVSLRNHEQCQMQIQEKFQACMRPCKGLQKYEYLCVFALQMKANVKNCLHISPLIEWPQRIVLLTTTNSRFHRKGEDYLEGNMAWRFLPYIFK